MPAWGSERYLVVQLAGHHFKAKGAILIERPPRRIFMEDKARTAHRFHPQMARGLNSFAHRSLT